MDKENLVKNTRKIMKGTKYSYRDKKETQGPKDSNLSWSELRGLKSLKKRISAGEYIIAQTDKSSRFAILSVDQYLKAGKVHTDNDKEIS